MKEVVVLSGKGGTGKTMMVASFAALSQGCVLADCDVDAPNMHLLMSPSIVERGPFFGMKVARIIGQQCKNCGECIEVCRAGAIRYVGAHGIRKVAIDERLCEGCAFCVRVCRDKAIRMEDRCVGEWFVSRTKFGPMAHALLEPGQENSGKLVAFVKHKARQLQKQNGASLLLVDGPPGIGCSTISSLSGSDLVLLIAEPTRSGAHDFLRVNELARSFRTRTCLVVNRYDINPEVAEEIERRALEQGVEVLGRVPHDLSVVNAMAEGRTVVEHDGSSPASESIKGIWRSLLERVEK